jgi:pimeloyl-ACP methyl ester carboxylesterase/DNA-binding winged helix-turn-helix (wHTH) protein
MRNLTYTFGRYRIDCARFQILRDNTALAVEPQVLELLMMLIDNRDHVVAREELLDTIWKGRVVSDATLTSRVKMARRVIGDDGTRQCWIKTIHGRGLRFVGDVAVQGGSEADAHARPATRYARSGDIHVAYQLFGDGPVNLIMAPGFVSHIDNYWDLPDMSRFLCRLGSGARVAMFDKRGTGMSDKVDALPGMDERMDDVRAVMDAAGFDTAFVFGFSEGGSMAALFAAYHPQRCDGLVLYGAFARFKHLLPDEAALQKRFDYVETAWGSGKSLQRYAPSVADDPAFVEWWGKFERLGATPGACIALMRMNSSINISGVLSGIRVPTLVIHRTGDTLVDVAAARELAAGIPGAQLLELPGADHLPMVGANRDEIVDAIVDFLDRPRAQVKRSRILATILLLRLETGAAPGPDAAASAFVTDRLAHYRAGRVVAQPRELLAIFDAPARSLACAGAVSIWLHSQGLGHRISVHAGAVEVDADALDGVAIRVAADIAESARTGEVLVSRAVGDLVAGSTAELEDAGTFDLPSIGERWHLYRLLHA